jgi:SAM domain (Sterile alpha motif).
VNKKASEGNATEKKRGPGRPPGSTRQSIEQQRLNADKGEFGSLIGLISTKRINLLYLPLAARSEAGAPPGKKSKIDSVPASTDPADLKAKNKIDVEALLKGTNPLKWSVQQVCDFVKDLPGCSDYVEDFLLQEIDGQALMLLKADHLMSAMAIKLGPALKICSAIDAMREELKQN